MSQANLYIPKGDSAIIRITDGGFDFDKLPHNYNHKLELSFYDIEPRVGLPSNWNWFNKKDGEKVIKFFKQISDCDELVIHCHAGVSRSPAIALSYGWFTGDENIAKQIKNGNFLPNRHVLEVMSRLIFEDKRVARLKFKEIVQHYKNLVESSKNEEITF